MAILSRVAACALLVFPVVLHAEERVPDRVSRESARWINLSDLATSDNLATADSAIAELRAAGPSGLAALLSQLPVAQGDVESALLGPPEPRLRRAIDAVAAQRDAWASGLYWYTDFQEALAVARASQRPILALHLLGQLSEDLSCANSRFFRQVLYADPRVAERLRDDYVLYWRTVRPAPKLTIDFGDGRRLVRTITGNSIHYVLDSEGQLMDALPGMYGAEAFLAALERAGSVARATNGLNTIARYDACAAFHRQEIVRLNDELQLVLASAGELEGSPMESALVSGSLDVLSPTVQDPAIWERLATVAPQQVRLHPASAQFVRRQVQQAGVANRLAAPKAAAETPFLRAITRFERSLQADTLRNELVLHRMLHDWLCASAPANFDELVAFNERVYAELFLAPLDDPWAGLYDPEVFTALDPAPEDTGTETAAR